MDRNLKYRASAEYTLGRSMVERSICVTVRFLGTNCATEIVIHAAVSVQPLTKPAFDFTFGRLE
jgi:hypothetical protein